MVENELVTGSLASRREALARYDGQIPPTPSEYQRESTSMDEENGGGARGKFERRNSEYVRDQRRGKAGSEGTYRALLEGSSALTSASGGRLYAEFMRNGGTNGGAWKGSMDNPGERGDYMSGGLGGGVDGLVNGQGRVEEIRSP